MKNILITGSTGFLGQHIINLINKEKFKIYSPTRNIPDRNIDNVEFIKIDNIFDIKNLKLPKLDVIIHLAAIVKHTRNQDDEIFKINVDGTLMIEEIAKKNNSRLIIASTSGVLENFDKIIDDSNAPNEQSEIICKEKWPYYDSKYQIEKKITYKNTIFLRPSMIFGPIMYDEARSLSTIIKFLNKKYPFIIDGGINYVDVRDISKVFVKCMSDKVDPGCYNLTGTDESLYDFFSRLEKISGITKPKIKLNKFITSFIGKIPTHIDPVTVEMGSCFWSVNSDKAKKELNFNPRDPDITLQDSIKSLGYVIYK